MVHRAIAIAAQQERHHAGHAVQTLEDCGDFVAREHGREMLWAFGPDHVIEPWQLNAEDLAIEEEQRVEGLVLRGRRDPVAHRERRRKAVTSAAPISAGWRLPWKKM